MGKWSTLHMGKYKQKLDKLGVNVNLVEVKHPGLRGI